MITATESTTTVQKKPQNAGPPQRSPPKMVAVAVAAGECRRRHRLPHRGQGMQTAPERLPGSITRWASRACRKRRTTVWSQITRTTAFGWLPRLEPHAAGAAAAVAALSQALAATAVVAVAVAVAVAAVAAAVVAVVVAGLLA